MIVNHLDTPATVGSARTWRCLARRGMLHSETEAFDHLRVAPGVELAHEPVDAVEELLYVVSGSGHADGEILLPGSVLLIPHRAQTMVRAGDAGLELLSLRMMPAEVSRVLPARRPELPAWPSGTMQAAAVRGVNNVGLIKLPIPAPAPGRVLVEPLIVGLCGTDLELMHGTATYLQDGRSALPHVFGHEWVGRIVAVADGAQPRIKAGDRVVGHTMLACGRCRACQRGRRNDCGRLQEVGLYGQQGAAAQFVSMPESALTRVPDEVDDRAAALVEPAVTVLAGLDRVRLGLGDRALVIGTGTIGLLAVQLAARVAGSVDVVGVEGRGLELARGFGARRTFQPGQAAVEYDVVIEAAGAASAFAEAVRLADVGGRVCAIGVPATKVPELDAADLVLRGITVVGVRHGLDYYERALGLFADGVLSADGMVTEPYPLGRVADAFAELADGGRSFPKVSLTIGG